eukprot:634835-Pyramimonas_sp.AAC.1
MKSVEDKSNNNMGVAQEAAAPVLPEAVDRQLKAVQEQNKRMQAELSAISPPSPTSRSSASAASHDVEKASDNCKIWIAGSLCPLLSN